LNYFLQVFVSRHLQALYAIETINEKGVACIPLNLHLANNKIKIKIALGKGKKKWDKREVIKKRDVTRDVQREMKGS